MGYSITDYILENVPKDFWQKEHFVKEWGEKAYPIPNWEDVDFAVISEYAGADGFRMYNTGGVEVEVGEFLYALTRILRPKRILETGTHLGISDLYFALALKTNNVGNLTTIEFNPPFCLMAQALFEQLDLTDVIELVCDNAEKWDPDGVQFDLVFLDTEPNLRYNEMRRFWPNIAPGGIILIHDLHPHLGLARESFGRTEATSFGDFREKIGDLIKEHELQTMSFPTPRGLTMFQKASDDFGHTAYLKGKI